MKPRENRWLNLRWPNSHSSFIGDRPPCSDSKSFSSPLIQYIQGEGQMWKTRIQKRCERRESGDWVRENEQEGRAKETGIGALPSSAYPWSAVTWHVNSGYTYSYTLTCALPCIAGCCLLVWGQGHALVSLCPELATPKHCPALGHCWPLGQIH